MSNPSLATDLVTGRDIGLRLSMLADDLTVSHRCHQLKRGEGFFLRMLLGYSEVWGHGSALLGGSVCLANYRPSMWITLATLRQDKCDSDKHLWQVVLFILLLCIFRYVQLKIQSQASRFVKFKFQVLQVKFN